MTIQFSSSDCKMVIIIIIISTTATRNMVQRPSLNASERQIDCSQKFEFGRVCPLHNTHTHTRTHTDMANQYSIDSVRNTNLLYTGRRNEYIYFFNCVRTQILFRSHTHAGKLKKIHICWIYYARIQPVRARVSLFIVVSYCAVKLAIVVQWN